MSKYFNRG